MLFLRFHPEEYFLREVILHLHPLRKDQEGGGAAADELQRSVLAAGVHALLHKRGDQGVLVPAASLPEDQMQLSVLDH